MTRKTRMSLSLFGCLVLLLPVGGIAWACTAQQQISILPRSGPVGSTVTVNGLGFGSSDPSGSTIEIRWNSLNGRLLSKAPAPDFSVAIQTPPDASPGVYYLTVLQRSVDGSVTGKSTETFEVSGSGASAQLTGEAPASSEGLWTGFNPSTASGSTLAADISDDARNSSASAIGLTLSAIGLAALGFAFVTLRSRRAKQASGDLPQARVL